MRSSKEGAPGPGPTLLKLAVSPPVSPKKENSADAEKSKRFGLEATPLDIKESKMRDVTMDLNQSLQDMLFDNIDPYLEADLEQEAEQAREEREKVL